MQICCIANCVLCLTIGAGQEKPIANSITPRDVIDGFKLNYQSFQTLRVSWRYSYQKKEALFHNKQAAASQLEKEAAFATGKEKSEMQKRADAIRFELNSAGASDVSGTLFDYWTNRQAFQIRMLVSAFEEDAEGKKDTKFPDAAVTPAMLQNVYKDIPIMSFTGDLKSGFRMWAGRKSGASYSAAVFKDHSAAGRNWLFPPLAINNKTWAEPQVWHIIDSYFVTTPVDLFTVSSLEKLGSTKVLLLSSEEVEQDAKRFVPPQVSEKYKGKLHTIKRTRAWVDPSRGFLPLKIEWDVFVTFVENDKTYSTYNGPYRRLVVEEIQKIPNAGYYPVKGCIQELRALHPSGSSNVNMEDFIRGKYNGIELGVYDEGRWDAFLVAANLQMQKGMFELPFPPNTMYYDETVQNGFLTSDPLDVLDNALIDKVPESQPLGLSSPPWRSIVILVNVALVSLIAIAYVYLKRRERRLSK
jgi:hypothetical protein